ncbi:MAG TPA: helix-turn-helix transcriptional regulator [Phycisphaerae bacterium]|nr:helix-turn-helix transcriptional regulator [Phycisphaerae bacterium]
MCPVNSKAANVRTDQLCEKLALELAAERSADDYLCIAPRPALHREDDLSQKAQKRISHGHEFRVVVSGSMRVTTAAGVVALSPRQLLLLGPDVTREDAPGDVPRPYVVGWCWINKSLAILGQTQYSSPAALKVGPIVRLFGRSDLESVASIIFDELQGKELGWEQSVRGLLTHLSTVLVRRLRRGTVVHPSPSPMVATDARSWDTVRAALQYCDANMYEPIRLTDVATAVGYSSTYLSRLISTHLGRSLFDYVRDARIQESKWLLRSTEMSITEIADSIGYRDCSYFTHYFTRTMGCSPRVYRRRVREP